MRSKTQQANGTTSGGGDAEGVQATSIQITLPDIRYCTVDLMSVPDSSLCLHRFSEKAQKSIMDAQAAGSQARSKKKRNPKNFEEIYQAARHLSPEGWDGVPASAFRNGMISACRAAGYVMTRAKLGLFIIADGRDQDGMPIVRIRSENGPRRWDTYARNANGGFDIRSRPVWDEWWIRLKVQYDGGLFSEVDVSNLLVRVGFQVGIGEGRPDSKMANGIGFGRFRLATMSDELPGIDEEAAA